MRLTRKKIKTRTAEFAEKGRRGGGGLKNGDLLIASKVRSIHFTDDGATTPQIVPCGLFVQLFRKKLREKQFVSASFFHKGRFQSFSHRRYRSISRAI